MHCTNCGKEIKENAKFCTHCGKVVSWTKIIQQPWINETHTGTWWDNKTYRILFAIAVAVVFVLLREQLKSLFGNTLGRVLHLGPQYANVKELKSMTCKEYKESSRRDKFVISEKLYTDLFGKSSNVTEGSMKIKYDVACEVYPDSTLGNLNISY